MLCLFWSATAMFTVFSLRRQPCRLCSDGDRRVCTFKTQHIIAISVPLSLYKKPLEFHTSTWYQGTKSEPETVVSPFAVASNIQSWVLLVWEAMFLSSDCGLLRYCYKCEKCTQMGCQIARTGMEWKRNHIGLSGIPVLGGCSLQNGRSLFLLRLNDNSICIIKLKSI